MGRPFRLSTAVIGSIAIAAVLFTNACTTEKTGPWTNVIPGYAPGVIIPKAGQTLGQTIEAGYMPLLDDISAGSIALSRRLELIPKRNMLIKGIIVFPHKSDEWTPIWVAEVQTGHIQAMAQAFQRAFFENSYRFHGYHIQKMNVSGSLFFAAQLDKWLISSESSLAIEEAIRSFIGVIPSLSIDSNTLSEERLIVNAARLDYWIKQFSAVGMRPLVEKSLEGLGIGSVAFTKSGASAGKDLLDIKGAFPVDPLIASSLTKGVSSTNAEPILDQYVSTDAAGFVIFQSPASQDALKRSRVTALDSALTSDSRDVFASLRATLDDEVAFVMYAPVGGQGIGENLFIRRLKLTREFNDILAKLASQGLIEQVSGGYYVKGNIFARLVGGDFCTYDNLYIATTGETVVLSPRLGLTTRVRSDRSRRRVIYYDDTYTKQRAAFSTEVSGFAWINSNLFSQYIAMYLSPSNNLSALLTEFDILVAATEKQGSDIQFSAKTFTREQTKAPYQERWVFPYGSGDITAEPVLADIGGSKTKEILFATTSGMVYGLATDGTVLFQASTGSDKPIGAPLAFDWYRNNQIAIMIAAGNKIYAWNSNGQPLPQFPRELPEQVTAPLSIIDVNRDGVPEMVIATEDRKLNVLDARGEQLRGWPAQINAVITEVPHFRNVQNNWSLYAAAENGIFAWDAQANLREGYPVFFNAKITSELSFHNELIMAGAADGHLYTLGNKRLFTDSLNVFRNTAMDTLPGGLKLGALNITPSPITGKTQVQRTTVKMETGASVTEDLMLNQSENGSLFLHNLFGQLRFTQSMGQPAATGHKPFIIDINADGKRDLLSVAGFGRLYGWTLSSAERIYTLPTAGMSFPVVTDLDGDGLMELIAQTRDGLRCWTIMKYFEEKAQ